MSSKDEPVGDASEGEHQAMTLFEHLGELRRRLMWVLAGLVITFCVCYWHEDALFAFCRGPYDATVLAATGEPLAVVETTEAFLTKLRVAFLAALFLSSPLTILQIWLFIAPGLYPRERRLAVPFVFFMSAFFVAGGAFAYLVGLPALNHALIVEAAAGAGFKLSIRAADYVDMFTQVSLGMGLVFEAPVIAFFLTRFGFLKPGMLVKWFRHAVVIIAMLAAVITPTGDIPSMLVFAVPMLGLYLVCIMVVWIFQKRERA